MNENGRKPDQDDLCANGSGQRECRLIDVGSYPVRDVLDILLQDRTSKKNIVWATDAYRIHGDHCSETSQITDKALLTGFKVDLVPRIEKNAGAQQERTRKNGEVFTPVWLCNRMNNYRDEEWFGRKDVFNRENGDGTWEATEGRIPFPDGKTWKDYVESKVLEITCGEAPFLVSRYDASTGDLILPPSRRIGILDRKLRIVNENATSENEWDEWVEKAFQSCYGYEFQGDSLLIARINMLVTFCDYFTERWGNAPVRSVLRSIAEIIAWNVWQMDGLKDTLPYGTEYQEQRQTTLFRFGDETTPPKIDQNMALPCKIMNWQSRNESTIKRIKRGIMGKKMFDFIIGNPPYQEEFTNEGNKTFAPPIYHKFIDASYTLANIVELIHPARFLFDAGNTPKQWNQKMLSDEHLKVLFFEQNASIVFPNTEIKGGVAVTYHDLNKIFGSIGTFTVYDELNSILAKIRSEKSVKPFSSIVISRTAYRLTEKMHTDYPNVRYKEDTNGNNVGVLSKGHDYDMSTNILDLLSDVFHDEKPNDGLDYIKILGRKDNERVYKYIRRDYVNTVVNLDKYKILLPKANGNGVFGEVLSYPVLGEPGLGSTETFISIGAFETQEEAEAALKFIKTKFARTLLGVLKVTQDLTPEKWKYVPLQDFTAKSDIDWTKSVPDIDRQLYRKYRLSASEIEFIESHVQEMNRWVKESPYGAPRKSCRRSMPILRLR